MFTVRFKVDSGPTCRLTRASRLKHSGVSVRATEYARPFVATVFRGAGPRGQFDLTPFRSPFSPSTIEEGTAEKARIFP